MDTAFLVSLVCKAPPLPAPVNQVVRASNTEELVKALEQAPEDTTILLADGLYTPPPDLYIRRDRISLRGESGNRDAVILDGGGAFSVMLRIKGACETLIADMTFRNCQHYGIFIFGDSDVHGTRIYNVKFEDIWTRAIKGTHPQRPGDAPEPLHSLEHGLRVRPRDGAIQYCLFVCNSVKPYDDWTGGDYISGIDMMMLLNWTFSDNVFSGIRGKNGGGRGAIFIWVYSEDVVVERNLIVDCDRGICFGNPSGAMPQVTRGIVCQNSILGGADKAIELCGTIDCEVAHNHVYTTNFAFDKTIHIFGGGHGLRMHHNVVHGHILVEDESAVLEQNIAGDNAALFLNPERGDLRLTE